MHQVLLSAEIPLSGLDGSVTKQELDLFELAATGAA